MHGMIDAKLEHFPERMNVKVKIDQLSAEQIQLKNNCPEDLSVGFAAVIKRALTATANGGRHKAMPLPGRDQLNGHRAQLGLPTAIWAVPYYALFAIPAWAV